MDEPKAETTSYEEKTQTVTTTDIERHWHLRWCDDWQLRWKREKGRFHLRFGPIEFYGVQRVEKVVQHKTF